MIIKLFLKVCLLTIVLSSFMSLSEDKSTEDNAFNKIYKHNIWGKGSGMGSNPDNARPYLALLQQFFEKENIKTYFDLGCGDWQLMSQIKIPSNKSYYGFDVVNDVINNDKSNYTKRNVSFTKINNFKDFVKYKGDLLIIKDVLQHLPNSDVLFFVENILPNFKYALITNDISYDANLNIDIKHGEWRPIDLTKSPFNLKSTNFLLEYYAHDTNYKRTILYINPSK